jgi:hypothetical protein
MYRYARQIPKQRRSGLSAWCGTQSPPAVPSQCRPSFPTKRRRGGDGLLQGEPTTRHAASHPNACHLGLGQIEFAHAAHLGRGSGCFGKVLASLHTPAGRAHRYETPHKQRWRRCAACAAVIGHSIAERLANCREPAKSGHLKCLAGRSYTLSCRAISGTPVAPAKQQQPLVPGPARPANHQGTCCLNQPCGHNMPVIAFYACVQQVTLHECHMGAGSCQKLMMMPAPLLPSR